MVPHGSCCNALSCVVFCNPLCIVSGMDLIDPKELESIRHQLEDAQRWNASLQARLGAIQNRGGGVGGANDGGKTRKRLQMSYSSLYTDNIIRLF